jgi:hypothetical protein
MEESPYLMHAPGWLCRHRSQECSHLMTASGRLWSLPIRRRFALEIAPRWARRRRFAGGNDRIRNPNPQNTLRPPSRKLTQKDSATPQSSRPEFHPPDHPPRVAQQTTKPQNCSNTSHFRASVYNIIPIPGSKGILWGCLRCRVSEGGWFAAFGGRRERVLGNGRGAGARSSTEAGHGRI